MFCNTSQINTFTNISVCSYQPKDRYLFGQVSYSGTARTRHSYPFQCHFHTPPNSSMNCSKASSTENTTKLKVFHVNTQILVVDVYNNSRLLMLLLVHTVILQSILLVYTCIIIITSQHKIGVTIQALLPLHNIVK